MIRTPISFVALLLSLAASALAARAAPPSPPPASVICSNTTLAVTTSSSNIQLPSASAECSVVTIKNDGVVEIYVAFGGSSVVADTSGVGLNSIPLAPGDSVAPWTNGTYVAAIAGTGTSNLRIMQGNGPVTFSGSSSGGGGSSPVTVADGADVTQGAVGDSAWTGTGNSTVVAALKAVYAKIAGLVGSTGAPSNSVLTVQTASPDPCQTSAKSSKAINQTANAKLISGVSAKKTYVCSILVVGADAENVSLVEGTGTVCATGTAAIIGGTTAATGPNFAANGGMAHGNGAAYVAAGATSATDVCLFQSGSGQVSGVLTYVQQ